MWEEGGGVGGGGGGGGSGGALGLGAGGRGEKEAYIIQFPREEEEDEEEGGMVDDEDGEGSLSGEGEEAANIKEEVRETGFLRGGVGGESGTASLRCLSGRAVDKRGDFTKRWREFNFQPLNHCRGVEDGGKEVGLSQKELVELRSLKISSVSVEIPLGEVKRHGSFKHISCTFESQLTVVTLNWHLKSESSWTDRQTLTGPHRDK